ncbi:MAG: carboxypeptidase regulatory-like domain-containing protein, partial [Planctomycetia bacterium]|nr:carboxypeptidase regulatory-like domain-containing protein [Planctomycetia bacterium]
GYLPGRNGEPAVRGYLPWGRRVEPAVRGMEPPVIMTPGLLGMFVPGTGGYYLNQSAEAFLPELSGTETQEELELREELIGLHVQAQKRLRKGKRLANASFFLMLITLVVALWGYRELIWSYAEVEPGFTVVRDPLETERILLKYTPDSRGIFSITYNDGVRETTIQEELLSEQIGVEQTFGWRLRDLKAEDQLTLTYREEFMLAQLSKSVENVKFAEDTLAETLTDLLLSGEIRDATNGKPISGAMVRIPGTKFSAESGAEGDFLVSGFPEGKQTFEVTADGFISYKFEMVAQPEPVRVLLSPGLAEGQIRVVLSWEKEPEDLDAHMEGPLPNKENFHISYGNKGNVDEQFVNLDIDASDGFGPETITVLGVVPGTYRYYVHDYTHQGESGSKNLAQSEAMVKIYYGNQVLGTFLPNADAVGNTWNVCEIQISEDQQASVKALGSFEDKSVQAMELYEKRTQENRLAWIEDYGGNADTEDAAAAALEWLARHQCITKTKTKRGLNPYGSWSVCCLDPESEHCRCEYPELKEGEKPGKLLCMDAAPDYMVANTGLAVLAFQAGGHYFFNDRKYSENVKLGLDWLVENQDKHGALVTPTRAGGYHEKFMYEHGIGTFALAEACAVTRAMGEKVPEKYQKAMEKAVRFTLKIQHNDGGWRYKMDPTEVSDTSVTGWQVLALKSAKEAGYQIPPAVIRKLKVFYERHTRLKNGETRYTNTMAGETEALTGIGLLVRQFLLDEGDSTYVEIGAERLRKAAISEWESKKEEERVPDFYTWYKCSLAMQQYGGRNWEVWNEIIRNELVRLMRRDGCQRGSWDPEADVYFDMGGGGRIYVTAMGALTLQVYYRYTTQRERQSQRTLSRVESP